MRYTIRLLPLLAALSPFALAWREDAQTAYAPELGEAVPGLDEDGEAAFARGRRLFRWKLWAPSRGAEGMNSTECTECHLEPAFGGTTKDKDLRVAMLPDDKDPSGFRTYHRIQLVPGQRSVRREPPSDAELRRPPALFGLGLLEAVPGEAIAKLSDPGDRNGDGISGRAIQVEGGPGRFGWKASVSTVDRFVIAAFKGELGILPEPIDQPDFTRLGPNQLRVVTNYIRLLGAPRPDVLKGEAVEGKRLFADIGCASCHTPSFTTSDKATAPQLRSKRIEPYADMLLHDMGPGAAVPETGLKPSLREYRTPPLWGLGKVGAPFLHDGSAATLEDAIRRHDGEALASRKRYESLSAAKQRALRTFLESL